MKAGGHIIDLETLLIEPCSDRFTSLRKQGYKNIPLI